jgi:methylated-DNA-[protein]-cysteine S-methyltransferase
MEYNEIHIHYYKSPLGELILGAYQDMLCLCDWRFRKMRETIDERIQNGLSSSYVEKDSATLDLTISQLDEYFQAERREFDISILFIGTEFQRKVWEALRKIPYGESRSYLELARMLGNEKAIRAVAAANGANALAIIIPCHRIVGSKGELTGYAGGLAAKQKLLRLESHAMPNQQLELF